MATYHFALAMKGDDFDNVIEANFAAADAMHDTYGYGPFNKRTDSWARDVYGKGGDDLMIRDRPGDYKPARPGDALRYIDETDEFHWYTNPVAYTGNVLVHGGAGIDTISYQQFAGAVSIDLAVAPNNVEYEPWYWKDHAQNTGKVTALGLSGQEIHGFDYVKSFENATGTYQADEIRGTDGVNTLKGLDGNDKIWGRGGNDVILGGEGHDGLHGDGGRDLIDGGEGFDRIWGGDHNDTLKGGGGNDTILGEDGDDTITGDGGNDSIRGGDGNDRLYGGTGYDRIWGEDGDDRIFLWSGGGRAYGGEGADVIHGSGGNDHADTGRWGEGADMVSLGGGNDKAVVGLGDEAHGGSGFDTLWLGKAQQKLAVYMDEDGTGYFRERYADAASEAAISGFEEIVTGKWDDYVELHGDTGYVVRSMAGDDMIHTDAGDDEVVGWTGDDTILSGAGDDTVRGHHGEDSIDAGTGDDSVFGGNDDDRIKGGDGEDTIDGGAGDDTIIGGEGDDRLIGGSGADGFVWYEGDTGIDRIADFAIGRITWASRTSWPRRCRSVEATRARCWRSRPGTARMSRSMPGRARDSRPSRFWRATTRAMSTTRSCRGCCSARAGSFRGPAAGRTPSPTTPGSNRSAARSRRGSSSAEPWPARAPRSASRAGHPTDTMSRHAPCRSPAGPQDHEEEHPCPTFSTSPRSGRPRATGLRPRPWPANGNTSQCAARPRPRRRGRRRMRPRSPASARSPAPRRSAAISDEHRAVSPCLSGGAGAAIRTAGWNVWVRSEIGAAQARCAAPGSA